VLSEKGKEADIQLVYWDAMVLSLVLLFNSLQIFKFYSGFSPQHPSVPI
jgi:hypothetical protein